MTNLDGWLTVLHRTMTLVDLQLDTQNSYLFIYNTFIKILYIFKKHYPAHLQEVYVVIVYMQPLVSSLSSGAEDLNRCTGQSPADSDDTRGCMYTITTWTS